MRNASIAHTLDLQLIRRLAVLKVWVDSNGLSATNDHWRPAHSRSVFDADRLLRIREPVEIHVDDIGALSTPAPPAEAPAEVPAVHFGFLAELDPMELILAEASERDRGAAIRCMKELPYSNLREAFLY